MIVHNPIDKKSLLPPAMHIYNCSSHQDPLSPHGVVLGEIVQLFPLPSRRFDSRIRGRSYLAMPSKSRRNLSGNKEGWFGPPLTAEYFPSLPSLQAAYDEIASI